MPDSGSRSRFHITRPPCSCVAPGRWPSAYSEAARTSSSIACSCPSSSRGATTSGVNAGSPSVVVTYPAVVSMPTRMTWARTWGFVRGAGKVIVITLTLMWALMAIPVTGGHSFGEVPVQDSAYGATAEAIAPVFAPAGFGSSFAQSFAVDEPDDAAEPGTLGDRLRATFDESSGGHGGAAAIAFMVFVLAYTPCLATIAEQKNVIGWKLTGITVGAQLVVAWVLAVGVFQVLRLFW